MVFFLSSFVFIVRSSLTWSIVSKCDLAKNWEDKQECAQLNSRKNSILCRRSYMSIYLCVHSFVFKIATKSEDKLQECAQNWIPGRKKNSILCWSYAWSCMGTFCVHALVWIKIGSCCSPSFPYKSVHILSVHVWLWKIAAWNALSTIVLL